MLASGDLDFSFSGLKTAVLTLARKEAHGARPDALAAARKADIALEFESAVVDVLVAKALAALVQTGRRRLVVAGGVGANRQLRARLAAASQARGCEVFFPDLGVLHGQRRDDRLGRSAAPGWSARVGLHVRRAAPVDLTAVGA